MSTNEIENKLSDEKKKKLAEEIVQLEFEIEKLEKEKISVIEDYDKKINDKKAAVRWNCMLYKGSAKSKNVEDPGKES